MEDDYAAIDGRRGNSNRPRMWTSQETDRLIEVWSRHETLYNTRHPDYYKRDKRAIAMNDICIELGDISTSDITRKMENLRSYYGREKRKMSDAKAEVSGEVKSRWAYFEPLSFLEEHMNLKKSTSRTDTTDPSPENTIHFMNDAVNDIYQTENPSSPIQHKKPKLNEQGRLDETIARLKPKENLTKLGPRHVAQHTQRDSIGLMPHKDIIPNQGFSENNFIERNDDMIFAEHVGRTIMSITDELLKEDLKLHIQQCLCSTKRKQIALQQEHQRRVIPPNNSSFISFATLDDPTSPVNGARIQIVSDETDGKTH